MNVEGDFRLQDVTGILRRRGKVASFTALFVLLAAYWVAMALPNVYTSYATVLVEPQSVTKKLVEAGVADSDLNERLHLMTAQILSRARLSRVIDEFGLYEDESEYMLREEVIDLMRGRIRVEPVISDLSQGRDRNREQDISEFKISFDDYSPQQARDVAQKLANDFIETHIGERVQVSQKSLDFIDAELQALADRIAVVESQIKEVKNENPGMNPEDRAANQRRLERTMADLASAQREFSTAMSDLEFYRSQAALEIPAPNDDASPARRVDILKLTLADLRSRGLTDKHPDVVKTRAELEQVEALLGRRGDETTPTESAYAGRIAAEMRRAEIRAAAANQEVERIRAHADSLERLIIGAPAVAERLDALMRNYEHLRASYQDFSHRQHEATVQAQLERRQLGEQFRVLEAAFIAPEPSAPNRVLIVLLGLVLGIALGAGTGVLLEALDTSAHDARTLQNQLQLPVLVSIPQIWLESDRIAQRRARIRTGLATAALVAFALVGGLANHFWVNGLPGFLVGAPPEERVSDTGARG